MMFRFCLLLSYLLSAVIPGLLAQTNHTSVLTHHRIYSQALQENRDYCLYLPENFNPQQPYPVLFATDGQSIYKGKYKDLLDSLIENKLIPSLILIGVYSNEQKKSPDSGTTLRFNEYACRDKKDPKLRDRYDQHSAFFLREIRDSVFSALHIQPDPRYILFYGCSNGGDYGMTLLRTHPEEFTHFLCFSPINTQTRKIIPSSRTQAHLYLSYGSQELASPMGFNLIKTDKTVRKHKDPRIHNHVYTGSHKGTDWEKEFARILPALFK